MKRRIPFWLATLLLVLVTLGRATAQDCYQSSILSPSPFMGNNGEIFKLADGSLWEVKYEYEYLYEYYPSVIICPSQGKLIVRKKSLNVQLVSGTRSRVVSSKGQSTEAERGKVLKKQICKGALVARCNKVEYSRQFPAMFTKLRGSRCSLYWSFSRK